MRSCSSKGLAVASVRRQPAPPVPSGTKESSVFSLARRPFWHGRGTVPKPSFRVPLLPLFQGLKLIKPRHNTLIFNALRFLASQKTNDPAEPIFYVFNSRFTPGKIGTF